MKSRVLLIASVSAALLAAYPAAPIATAAPPKSTPSLSRQAAAALLTEAFEYQQKGAFASAVTAYTEALRGDLSPKMRATATYNRAVAHQRAGHPTLAVKDFDAALLLNPGLAHAYYGRANALLEIGQYFNALADYEKAAHYAYPERHLPLFGQALAYEFLNRPLSAEKLLRDTLQLKPGFEPAAARLAKLQTAAVRIGSSTAPETVLSVSVKSKSIYGLMTDRINQIVTSSISAVAPDQVVRKPSMPRPVRPPSHLLDAAEQVEVATVKLPGLQSISFSQTPASLSPAFLVAEKTKLQKIQDRVPQPGTDSGVAQLNLKIEPVSAPVEYKTRTLEEPKTVEAAVDSAPQGFLVQINSQRSENAAWAAWKSFQKKHGKLLTGKEAIVQKAELGKDGTVYRLRIKGLATRDEAKSLCGKLEARGLACFVVKTGA
jgi:tetratricopeptide (TPR) repeat protein